MANALKSKARRIANDEGHGYHKKAQSRFPVLRHRGVQTNMIVCQTEDHQGNMASQRISVPRGIAQRLKERSLVSGARESEVVREALERYLSSDGKEETTYTLLREAGLIGCARGAPKDLSTNKRYFRGFGKSK